MDNENITETIVHAITDFLTWAMARAIELSNWLPDTWPSVLKFGLIFFGVIFLIVIIESMIELLFSSPITLLNRIYLLFKSPFGKAKWSGWIQLFRGNLLKSGGLYLGQWRKWFVIRQNLFHHGEGHFITIASPGGGKSSSIIVPTLLEADKRNSFVVTDPSGELTAITRRYRESVSKCFFLNPFFEDFRAQTELDYIDSGFNPFDFIDNSSNTRSYANNLAQYLCVTDRQSSDNYFNNEGKTLLSLFISWIVRHESGSNKNLAYLHSIVRESPLEILRKMIGVDDPLLRFDAQRFIDMKKGASPQWTGAVSKAHLATQLYIPSTPLATHTSTSSFNPSMLKQEDITVYVLLPSEHVKAAAPWLNMVMGLLGEAVGRAGESRPVTFLLDELPALGYLPDLIPQMRQHRRAGLRMWLFSQTTAALSDRAMYGQDGLDDIFELCTLKQFFSIQYHKTAEVISTACGKASRIQRNLNPNENTGVNAVEVPLIRADEIIQLPKGWQVLIYKNLPPIKARLIPYFTRRKWRKMTDPNPYI